MSPGVTQEAPALPEPSSLARPAWAQIDWEAAEKEADVVTSKVLTDTGEQLVRVSKAFGDATDLEGRSHQSLVAALVDLYEVSAGLLNTPEVVWALCQQRQLKPTKATLASASLPVVRLAVPTLDAKTQSLYANAMNFALACGYDATAFRTALEAHGVKELAKHEAARKRAAKGEPAQLTEEELVDRFREERRSVVIEGIELLPPGCELALLIVGEVDGEIRAFAFDDEPKRLMAAVRKASATGAELPSRGVRPAAEAA